MASEKASLGNCIIFALALAEVTSWTIDLPEYRKYLFDKVQEEKEELREGREGETERPLFYNNIEGNSPHNSEHFTDYESTAYAREYGYESYMEKQVHGIVYNGSVYLEGLRRALEQHARSLEDCNRMNFTNSQNGTAWRPSVEMNYTSTNSPNNSTTNSTFNSPNNSTSGSASNSAVSRSRCRAVSAASEHVRRLSQLAMWTTRELQDIAYARKYHKGDGSSLGMQENELILKLAWFLDRLAYYTGYEPDAAEFAHRHEETTTTSTSTPASPMNASAEVTQQMMSCLHGNSSQAGVERCRYPAPLPPLVQLMMEMNSNITGIPSSSAGMAAPGDVMPLSRASRSEPLSRMEILVAADTRPPSYIRPAPVRHIQKRSLLSMFKPQDTSAEVTKTKISPLSIVENDPAINFLKYFAKHKAWEGSNLQNIETKFQEFEVKNEIQHGIHKRAVSDDSPKRYRLPENPFQDLSKYVKHRPGVNYVKDEDLAAKIKAALEKMDEKRPTPKRVFKQLTKLMRPKKSYGDQRGRARRYVAYEKDVDLPRESVDPQKDISFYTKNKEGRRYNSDLLQAAQVRLGLEQIFNTGNIEVVRRFGANYNPANPNPFMAGVIASQADF